ncbi:VanZ family protein [Dysgonomonas sp. GY617]|nr:MULTISPECIES: VanZ family protein [unclassified Dysgonomonas]MBD8348390.1 VanZ family protein [Dysgonomonas sp. HGC4]MBF0575338.1 VanZ family protein [Dysgonomonas sp. GY617]
MSYSLIRYSIVPIFISLVILYLCCLIPTNDIPEVSFDFFIPMDKIVHFCMYLGLSGATAINYIHGKRGHVNTQKLIIAAFLLPILYGGFIEILQHYFFPPRAGDWFDFLADMLGSLTALPIAFQYRNYLKKKHIQ